MGADFVCRSDWPFEYREYGVYEYPYQGDGDWDAEGNRHEPWGIISDIPVGRGVLWNHCCCDWGYDWVYLHDFCGSCPYRYHPAGLDSCSFPGGGGRNVCACLPDCNVHTIEADCEYEYCGFD